MLTMLVEIVSSLAHASHVAGLFRRFSLCIFCFFFFQAEDGIRDLTVTGVQTCALPIYLLMEPQGNASSYVETCAVSYVHHCTLWNVPDFVPASGGYWQNNRLAWLRIKIGRASCRERV